MTDDSVYVHATTVAFDNHGVLITGPSGSGKSDLAVRLIDRGAVLVADDQTRLYLENNMVMARAAKPLAGLMEVRGLGILKFPHAAHCPLACIMDLTAEPARLPDQQAAEYLGHSFPVFRINAFENSAPCKVGLALKLVTGTIIRHDT